MLIALVGSQHASYMQQAAATLASDGIDASWVPLSERRAVLWVHEFQRERAVVLLSDQLAEDLAARRSRPRSSKRVPLPLQPAFAAAVGMAALLIAAYAVVGGAEGQGPLFTHAALVSERWTEGEWWRVVTAAMVHADLEHVASNALFVTLLGWAAAERVGVGIMPWVWLTTAVGGFLVSLTWGDASWTVGASGGLFGLLGVAGGHALRWRSRLAVGALARLRAFGSAVLLLAMTAFSPRANLAAHLGGFVAGLLLGIIMPRARAAVAVQIAAAAVTVLVVTLAWSFV
ncbi:MAG: rhomboid family intramembrane serine protease [Myxococcota bacterium]